MRCSSVLVDVCTLHSAMPFVHICGVCLVCAELGRATWTFLHMLAAQYPDRPTRQQKRDVKQLIECLTRVYPCASCASHFKEIVK